MTPQTISSDVPAPSQEWLEEPTPPKKEMYSNPENYAFAQEEYKKLMATYKARYELHDDSCNFQAEKEEIIKNANKNPFRCVVYETDPKTGQPKIDPKSGTCIEKSYPNYDFFCPINEEEKALGYGGSAKKEGFKTALVAKWIIDPTNNLPFKTDMKTGILYFYDGKTWTRHGEPYLKKIVSIILGKENRESHFKNIKFDVESRTLCKIEFSKKIAVENGILDLEATPITLEPFSPKEMTFYSLPVTYNPNVDPRKLDGWLEFLKQVVNPEDIPLLQEWFGYCFLPSLPFHKTLWIWGKGRNGKGVYDRTIQGIIGADNCHEFRLEVLDERFKLKGFYGKLYAVCSEPASNKVFRTEIFQKLTGGDRIEAEFKGKNEDVRFVNCAKITIIGNKFSKVDNPTEAFKDRMMFVKFTRFFSDEERIHDLEQKWLGDSEQRSAIFNWGLEGLLQSFSQNGFTKTQEQRQTEIEFERISNPVSAFQKDIGIIAKGLVTTRTAALEAYQQYTETHGIPLQKNYQSDFTKQMQTLAPKVRDGWTKVEGKNQRAWLNFGIKPFESEKGYEGEPQEPQQPHPFILTDFSKDDSKNIENKSGVVSVVNVAVPKEERDGIDYQQLSCYVCGKGIYENDWVTNDFTENKPCHRKCHDDLKAQLKSGPLEAS
jgi:P4 family phage/plasmid primase-like protien